MTRPGVQVRRVAWRGSSSRAWVLLLSVVLFLTATTIVAHEEDVLVAMQLGSSCTPLEGCVKCDAFSSDQSDMYARECAQTGYVQRFDCGNKTSEDKTQHYKYEACSPQISGSMEMLRFNLIMVIGAVFSLAYVRRRKQLAAYNLISLVNRTAAS